MQLKQKNCHPQMAMNVLCTRSKCTNMRDRDLFEVLIMTHEKESEPNRVSALLLKTHR